MAKDTLGHPKQFVAPVPELPTMPVVSVPGQPSYVQDTRDYLEERGWKLLGMNEHGVGIWDDPLGCADQKGKIVPGEPLPNLQGEPITWKQLEVPPGKWEYQTHDAMRVQMQRDAAEEKKKKQKGAA